MNLPEIAHKRGKIYSQWDDFFLLDKWDELQMKNARHEFDYLTSMTGAWEEKKLINSENVLWLSICVSSTTEIWCNFWNIMSIGGIDEF